MSSRSPKFVGLGEELEVVRPPNDVVRSPNGTPSLDHSDIRWPNGVKTQTLPNVVRPPNDVVRSPNISNTFDVRPPNAERNVVRWPNDLLSNYLRNTKIKVKVKRSDLEGAMNLVPSIFLFSKILDFGLKVQKLVVRPPNDVLFHKCYSCGHRWKSRDPYPKRCAKCNVLTWNRPK